MSYHNSNLTPDQIATNNKIIRFMAIGAALAFFLVLLAFLLWTPLTGPWKQERMGMANYRKAVHERQIIVAKAQGELDAAEAQADAITIMGQAARDNPEYRTQMFIQAFSEALSNGAIEEIIYVPVETDLPILEAGGRVSR
jgi:hypothetical protein